MEDHLDHSQDENTIEFSSPNLERLEPTRFISLLDFSRLISLHQQLHRPQEQSISHLMISHPTPSSPLSLISTRFQELNVNSDQEQPTTQQDQFH